MESFLPKTKEAKKLNEKAYKSCWHKRTSSSSKVLKLCMLDRRSDKKSSLEISPLELQTKVKSGAMNSSNLIRSPFVLLFDALKIQDQQ